MSKSTFTSGLDEDDEGVSELFGNLSMSLDSKFAKQKHIIQKPRLKRLVKLKSSDSSNAASDKIVCSRCRKETNVRNEFESYSFPEKEVDVKKEKSHSARKVHFVGSLQGNECDDLCRNDFQSDRIEFRQTQPFKSYKQKPSIVGDNEFWLPQRDKGRDVDETASQSSSETTVQNTKTDISDPIPFNENYNIVNSYENKTISPIELELVEFFNNIFKETIKREAKILQVVTTLGDILVTLTDEYVFQCRRVEDTFEIVNAIPLKDVQAILVDESCTLLNLQVCRASALIEYKEFVPGFPENTESLISLMVYAISRIRGSIPNVTRIHMLSLPNLIAVKSWYLQQKEELMFCGIVVARHASEPDYDFSGESFMMKSRESTQFHPASLLLRYGQIITECNLDCKSDMCKHSNTIQLQNCEITRENNPWPNSVRLEAQGMEQVTLACSSKACADDLVDKLYSCMKPSHPDFKECVACVLVTEYSLQLFQMDNKTSLFGAPLLNVKIFSKEDAGFACFIDTEGIEAEAGDNILQLHYRWELDFLSEFDKIMFMEVSSRSNDD